jgi:hypothetical protein
MPFLKPEQPFYTYSIDIATLWGGLWYLIFEIQHAEHGQMHIGLVTNKIAYKTCVIAM